MPKSSKSGGVYRREGSPYYQGKVMIRGRYYYNTYTTDKAESARRHREWKHEMKERTQSGRGHRTWDSFKKEFFEHLERNKAHGTFKHYKAATDKLEAFRRPRELADITPKLLYDLHAHLCQNNIGGPVARNKAVNCIKYMMHWAEQWEYVRPQMWRGIKLEKERRREEYFTLEQTDQMLAACGQNMNHKTIVLLPAHAGLRPCEIVTLNKTDVNLNDQSLSVFSPKTKRRRTVIMTPTLTAHLRDYLKIVPPRTKLLLHNAYGGHYTAGSYTQIFKKIAKKAGLRGFPYMLRHAYATILKNKGVDPAVIGKLMDHTRLETTTIYTHIETPTLRAAVANIPAPNVPKNVPKKLA